MPLGWYINTDPLFEGEGVSPYDWSRGANCGLMSLLPDCVSPSSRLCSLAEQQQIHYDSLKADKHSSPVGCVFLYYWAPHLKGVLIVRRPKLPKTGGRSTDDTTDDGKRHTLSRSMCIFNTQEVVNKERDREQECCERLNTMGIAQIKEIHVCKYHV